MASITSEYYESRIYLKDTNLYEYDDNIHVLSCEPIEQGMMNGKYGESTHKLVLNKTVFHPQGIDSSFPQSLSFLKDYVGGGQPSDQGTISLATNEQIAFKVVFVQNNASGTIEHFGHNVDSETEENKFTNAITENITLKLAIDPKIRKINSQLHSLGHMLDAAMKNIGYDATRLKPTKGYHFQDAPYVEYEIVDPDLLRILSSNDSVKILDEMRENLLQNMIELIHGGITTTVEYRTEEGKDNGSPPNLVRVVNVAGCECPCGGTHIVCDEFKIR